MQLHEISYPDRPPVDGYGPGFFRVGGETVLGAVLLTPSGQAGWGGPGDVARLLAEAGDIDVLLVGMGADVAALPADARQALEAAGIGVEAMATPSACRTYNVLLSEGRRVAAALLPV